MIQAFRDGKDIYASIGSIAFGVPYEDCLEFKDGEYNPEGKKRRDSIKTVLLGVTYGRSVETVAEQLYGKDKSLTREEMIKKGQAVIDSVMFACPALRSFMINAQNHAKKYGFVETVLGRRRHIPDMQLPTFEFRALPGYINPDIDPMDISTLVDAKEIPERIVNQLTEEFSQLKYFGQIMKRIRELNENDKIKVINNKHKIAEAQRKCVNSVIQGSAGDQIKLAMLEINRSPEWHSQECKLLLCIHDELIAEAPIEYAESAAELLKELMCNAADFLPFPSKCDVTTTYRWYGLEYPCTYTKPTSLVDMTENEIKWIQYHLFECGYEVPILKEGGKELSGDAALGVNGIWTDSCQMFIDDYIRRYRVPDGQFIDHIHKKVHSGII